MAAANYTEWEHHIPDYSVADDGFGNLEYTDLDLFWYNVDNMRYEREGAH
jgi:hypothetical protein